MKVGDKVRVYPHGSPAQAATATVLMISKNQRSIAIAFDDKPPFAIARRGGHWLYEGRITMLATRAEIDGKPWGPWVELVDGGHYEMEQAEAIMPAPAAGN